MVSTKLLYFFTVQIGIPYQSPPLPPPPFKSILSSFSDNLPVHIYTRGSTEATMRVECLAQEQGLEPRPLELKSSTLSVKPPLLPLEKRKTVPQIVTE